MKYPRRFLIFALLGLTLPSLAIQGLCQEPSIGIVLTGGGSFGAFEAGALQAFFDSWAREHNGNPPPVSVIAGASTGALIGPFAALGPTGVAQVSKLYRNVRQGDILRPKVSALLPFVLFSQLSSSVFTAKPLAKLLATELPDDKLTQIARGWPGTRLVVLATNFGAGRPATFSNAPDEIALGLARFRDGILASTISSLATPPVYIKAGNAASPEAHLDGGVHAVAPFQALFDLAGHSPAIELTQIVVFSPYPLFPGTDSAQVQSRVFPARPQFGDIASRMDALISESSIAKEVGLAWAAIELRKAGLGQAIVRERTGLDIPKPPRDLILIAPDGRLGWDNLKFQKRDMEEMFKRGTLQPPRTLIP